MNFSCLDFSGEYKNIINLLQGQLSCDVKNLEINKATIGSASNETGKSYATFIIIRLEDNTIRIILDSSLKKCFSKHIGKFLPFFKTTVRDSLAIVDMVFLKTATETRKNNYIFDVVCDDCAKYVVLSDSIALKLSGQDIGIDKQKPTVDAKILLEQDDFYQWYKKWFKLGIAILDSNSTSKFIPNMFNYDLNNGISFNKGCYVGQEAIARVYHRGEVKQRMYFFKTEIFNEDFINKTNNDICLFKSKDKKIGSILSHYFCKERKIAIGHVVMNKNFIEDKVCFSHNHAIEIFIKELLY
jgi:folate-binding protein YgfZ